MRGFRSGKFQDNPIMTQGNWTHVTNKEFADPTHYFNCHLPPLSRGSSRYGSVIRIEEPVTITYTEPLQRVLFNPNRDCNPFFHFVEALWMLAGQNNVQPLTHFAKRMGEFSDDDLVEHQIPFHGKYPQYHDNSAKGFMWGAYGYRWRQWFTQDQLYECITILRSDPTTRRVVLQMWSPDDLTRVRTNPTCKDVPCNLCVMFMSRLSQETHRLHTGQQPLSPKEKRRKVSPNQVEMTNEVNNQDHLIKSVTLLDMTVINRSNDTLWGALGSNYVHFSFLHEFIANAVGMGVGYYHQISNNLHIYTNKHLGEAINNEKWSDKWLPDELCLNSPDPYQEGYEHYPLFRCPYNSMDETTKYLQSFQLDLQTLFTPPSGNDYLKDPPLNEYSTPFFQDVVSPLLRSWQRHKLKQYDGALFHADQIVPKDWRLACRQWLLRRSTRLTKAQDGGVHANS